ncbi:tail spike protein [Salmonella phage CRW-SP2]|nr:tail spike protein [Salmonella phage CRW-SP2]
MNPQFSQPKGSVSKETNKEAVARRFGCKKSEVVYAKPGQSLNGYKVIYDKITERAYALPSNLGAVTITSLTDGILVHSGGTVDLGALAVSRGEFVTLGQDFNSGFTLSVKNEVVIDGTSLYIWTGSFPKTVSSGSSVSTSGGIGTNAWQRIGASGLKQDLLDANYGSKIISTKQSITGSSLRTQFDKNSDTLSIKDFGALGDGTTDDTAAIQAALDAVAVLGKKLYAPAGVYRVGALTYQPTTQTPLVLIGDGVTNTIFRKIGSSTSAMLLVGKNPSTFFIKNCVISGITFDAVDKVSYAALQMLDCWFTELDGVLCNGGQVGLEMLTPIFVKADSVTCQNSDTGLSISYWAGESFPSSQPGVIEFNNSVFQSNSLIGVKFNDGENLILSNCAIEGNGTTPGDTSQGGVYVGANVGRFMSGTIVPGLVMRDCHLESNKGFAGVAAYSGRTLLDNVFFWEGGTNTTHDVAFDGGLYTLRNCTAASPKAGGNVYEGPVVGTGNMIIQCAMRTLSINESKTTVFNDAALVTPFVKIGGPTGPAASLTFQNSATYWEMKQLASSSFGLYNGTSLVNYCDTSGNFIPGSDNNKSNGIPSNRWSVVYAGTGSISTSDREAKQDETELSDKEREVAVKLKGLIRKYKFKDAVEEKGEDARWHVGIIAQDVKAAFEEAGLVAEEYGILCYDSWEEEPADIVVHPAQEEVTMEVPDEKGGITKIVVQPAVEEWEEVRKPARKAGSRYGVRYDELLAFIIATM